MVCLQNQNRFISAIGRIPLPMMASMLWTGLDGHGGGLRETKTFPVTCGNALF